MQQRDSNASRMLVRRRSLLSLFFYADGAAMLDIPCALRDSFERRNTQRENEMKTTQILKISAAPAAVFCALAFFTTATPVAAAPVDYCRADVTSGMRGCGYSSLEQCQSMYSGRGGSCFENPFPTGGGSASSSAYAYQPTHRASKSGVRHHAKQPDANQ
jgi:hypothetical protein